MEKFIKKPIGFYCKREKFLRSELRNEETQYANFRKANTFWRIKRVASNESNVLLQMSLY